MYSKIIGTGSYFPEKVLTNQDLTNLVDTSDEWIVSRTGMRTRHIASPEETVSEMGYKAALSAIQASGLEIEEIDGLILSTVVPDYVMPTSATLISRKLGISNKFAFDINMACSGFLYAYDIADSMIRVGKAKTVLVVSCDKLTSVTNYNDRSTCVLFGDGAGAVVLTRSDKPGMLGSSLFSDGAHSEILTAKCIGSVSFDNRDNFEIKSNMIYMNGAETFRLAVRHMGESCIKLMDTIGIKKEEIDCIVPHQANIRIIEALAKRFDIGMDKFLINLDRRGNTGSATIPTALDEGIRSGKIKSGDKVLITAFGGGAGWGAALFIL